MGRPVAPRHGDVARQRLRSDLVAFGFIALLLWSVTFLPTDTTLAEVRRVGTLRACLPDAFPPLVTGDPVRPGIDVELLEAVADGLGVRLVQVRNSAIGRDFNPRNWRLTRAQCLVIAGGIVDTTATRGFLTVTPPHLETGWAAVAGDPGRTSLDGARVGFHAALTGLDRIALSGWLRSRGAVVTILSDAEGAIAGLSDGRFDVIVTEGLTARRIAEATGRVATWLPVGGGHVPLAFGLWKGDLTLERAIESELRRLVNAGFVTDLLDRYELGDVESECRFCGEP